MIQELLDMGWDKERIISSYVQSGMSKGDAQYIYAIETGEIEGDIIVVDENGNETTPPCESLAAEPS
jgi:hypothetical protein